LNPALRPPIWNKARFVPRGYALRFRVRRSPAEIAAAWAGLAPTTRYVVQRNDGPHRVRRGETLAGIAAASGVSLNQLLAANGWSGTRELARGEVVHIPVPASRAEASVAGAATARDIGGRCTTARRRWCSPEAHLSRRVQGLRRRRNRFQNDKLKVRRCCRRLRPVAMRIPPIIASARQTPSSWQAAKPWVTSRIGPKSVRNRCGRSTGCTRMPW